MILAPFVAKLLAAPLSMEGSSREFLVIFRIENLWDETSRPCRVAGNPKGMKVTAMRAEPTIIPRKVHFRLLSLGVTG